MYSRFLITVGGELNNSVIAVCVGQISRLFWCHHYAIILRFWQALNVVGQAGKPRTISGFQTYQTPMWLASTK
ncbi:hypothetical protein B0H14DRAFT_2400446 [Mycena olivaceomarginata]|nr:hypothetical protein B0H14DRAFT_2400446 [Mycena olivaceomarginata]